MWSLLEKAVNTSTAALDVVKRDVTDFCKTLSEDTTNYMQGNAETPFGEPKGSVQSSRAPGEFPAAQTEAARDSVLDVPTYNCQQTKLDSIQSNPDTYSKPPDSMAEFDKWCAEFDFDRHSTEIAQLLIKQNIRSLHAKLVPIQVSYRDFWLRYFYQVHLMDKDTERRAALRAFADQAVQNTMDDWSDGDGWDGADDDWQPTTTSKSSSMTLPVTRTPQTTSTSSLISTDLASTPTQATVTVASATASALVSPDADARGQYSYAGSAKKHADSRPPTLSKAEEVKGTSTGSNALRQTDGGGFQRQISTDASSPLSSSSEPSSPTTSPALSPHSTNKPISSRSRRVRPVAHQKLRPGQSLPSTASSTECHSQKRRKPSDSKPGMPTISSSSSLADDEEVDSQDTDISLQHVPTLQSVQDSLLDVTDETSGSEIVVLGTGEGCQSPPRRMTPSRSVITSTRRAQYPGASLSAIASPPPSSACSEFELISEPEPLDATSSAQRTHQAAASIASPVALHSSPLSLLTTTVSTTTSTGSQPAMAVSSNSTLKAVGNAAVVSTTTVATEAAAGGSEEDWESWD